MRELVAGYIYYNHVIDGYVGRIVEKGKREEKKVSLDYKIK